MRKFNLSVHELVDFVLHSGDLDTRIFNLETMTRGTQIHAFYQAKQNDKYLSLIHIFSLVLTRLICCLIFGILLPLSIIILNII